MSTQYAVMHTSKIKSSGGLGNHIDRVEGMEHTYQNADFKKIKLNHEYAKNYKGLSLSKAIENRIDLGYTSHRKIRYDSVKALGTILSGSHERMKEIESKPEELDKWVAENYKFMCEEFGEENIVRFTLHRDELTPHIHCIHVPITKNGGLSARMRMGGREKMQERQTKYAEAMQPFGLSRGEKYSKATHQKTAEYKKLINSVEKEMDANDLSHPENVPYLRRGKHIKRQQEVLKSTILKLKIAELELKDARSLNHRVSESNSRNNNLMKSHFKDKKAMEVKYENLLLDPKKYVELAEKAHEKEMQKQSRKGKGLSM